MEINPQKRIIAAVFVDTVRKVPIMSYNYKIAKPVRIHFTDWYFWHQKKGHQWQYKKTYRMLVQLLSLFPGTFVWVEKQMTGGWTRNVIISFLSPLTVAAGRTGGALQRLSSPLSCNALSRSFLHWVVPFLTEMYSTCRPLCRIQCLMGILYPTRPDN